jgi:hypothetical protein
MTARLYPALMSHVVGRPLRPQVFRGQLSTIRVSGSIVKEVQVCTAAGIDLRFVRA